MVERRKVQGPPYKALDGRWLTRTLFLEEATRAGEQSTYEPVFTLRSTVDGYIDARASFLALKDPTGYLWAIKYLGSFEHWERLLTTSWFELAYTEWLRELKTILKQEALQKVIQIAQGGSVQAFAASKYLASAEWERSVRRAGAPSKEEMTGELKKAVQVLRQEDEDAKRMGLTLIQGGKE